MPVHVSELVTEVVAEGPSSPEAETDAAPPEATAEERRRIAERLQRELRRTSARGFDD